MNEKQELWVGPTVSSYALYVAANAPDAMVTLGVLFYIFAHRAYSGCWYGWTQVPVQHLATRGLMGFSRIRDALDWLVKQEMIVPELNPERIYQARRYKVVVRKTLEERQAVLKSTPKEVVGGPTTEIVFWSPASKTVEWQTVSSEYANSLSRCERCGNFYDPTLGKHPTEKEQCIVCYLIDTVDWNESAHLILECGEYDWTVKKVNEFLKLVENRVEI